MNRITKSLLTVLLSFFATGMLYAQPASSKEDKILATFRFLSKEDLFTLKGNESELTRLYALIEDYRSEITDGIIPVYVDGYCASLPTSKENLKIAFIRANRVKSELILNKGLKEADFVTKNYAAAYEGNKDMVVVTLRIPRKAAEPKQAEPVKMEPKQPEPVKEEPGQAEPNQQPVVETTPEPVIVPADGWSNPNSFAVRTNILYDAMLLPTLGIEWRINSNVGIKLDGSLSWWSGTGGKVQKMWLLNPEVRWYMGTAKRFYAGFSGNYGEYNIYKYLLGGIVSKDTGYQGTMWGAGVTVGYGLPLSRSFSIDFNIGLGYTRSDYDSFTLTDDVRVYKHRDKTKNFWGPTQVGISLVWTLGSK
ncbi:DUF3575 domain-containing protein [Phocaeicola sp.]